MAVTKIRKVSSWILLASTFVTLVILGLFFFGGSDEPYKGEYWAPTYLGLLLNWMYILFAVCAGATLIFAVWQFISNLKINPRGAIGGLVVILAFFALLFITYTIGSDAKVNVLNSEAQAYNVPFWLKVTDMWLYSTYTLVVLVVLAIFSGSLKRMLNK
ncbi:MAG: hypothetical protein PHG27_03945 [Massilibacteroides sp.]|nr:hypothetical protein [Massilibacteroides sp.]MDD3062679.1 hypothetical protein [Massilibacteroides sp.]MDD4114735.1 hypothetical protein [Massilibacteroides sp.]MDD4660172.1 hypothetical protein [Massilibacteroides sp.]